MSNLSSFAELVLKASEEKKSRLLEEKKRREEEFAPLLSELFSNVISAKTTGKITDAKEAPLLAELKSIITNPSARVELSDDAVKLIEKIEEKAVDIKSLNKDSTTVAEKQFLVIFNKLQADFQTLKKYVDGKTNSGSYGGSAGSGEVRILRMDDMVKGIVPIEGDTLIWSSALNKFELKQSSGSSGIGPISDEDMPYSKRIDFISDNELYKAEAVVGASELAAVWRIRKVTIGNDFDMVEVWASGNSTYDKRWSDRLTYTYL